MYSQHSNLVFINKLVDNAILLINKLSNIRTPDFRNHASHLWKVFKQFGLLKTRSTKACANGFEY
jgi:hypothetical protein